MKAVVYNKKALPDKLVYSDLEIPAPGDDELLIEVRAVSINAADYRSMNMGIIPRKKIFGSAMAGRVAAAGKRVQRFRSGDEVMADLSGCGFGGFAEYVALPGKALISKPAGLSFETAAALPLAATTALQALRDKGRIQQGQAVLIVGAGGGVGTYAVQLAKYFGARVTAVCGAKNIEQTRALGADHVIGYEQEDFTQSGQSYDLVVIINGNYPLMACRRILKRTGVCVVVGGALSLVLRAHLLGRFLSPGAKTVCALAGKADPEDLAFVAKLAEEGSLRPVMDRRYPLAQTAEAMRYAATGHARGKVVIIVDGESKKA